MGTSQYSSSFGRLQSISISFLSEEFVLNLLKASDVNDMIKQLESTWYGTPIKNSASVLFLQQIKGHQIKIFDPVAKIDSSIFRNLEVYQDPYLSVHNSDMLIIMTEWNQFLEFDYSKVFKVMNNKNVVDARNILDNSLLKTLGFNYTGIGVT